MPTTCPRLLVWNKADLADRRRCSKILLDAYPGSVAISAATGDGIPDLLAAIGERLRALAAHQSSSSCPTNAATCWPRCTAAGEVLVEVHGDRDTRVRARLPKRSPVASPSTRSTPD